ncbi:MAG: hypothetical protein ACO1PB_04815 [Ramlibacter sp.]
MLSPASSRLLRHLLTDARFQPFLTSAERPKHRAEWRTFVSELTGSPPSTREEGGRFHDQWHVCHHYLRELVDDEPAVLDMLWIWLPRYEGPDLTLYRGENVDRLDAGRLGIAWTDEIEKARMFAGGLNARGKGGALLRAIIPAEAIIAGPSRHSLYIQESEFTVDPRKVRSVERLERFPPIA